MINVWLVEKREKGDLMKIIVTKGPRYAQAETKAYQYLNKILSEKPLGLKKEAKAQ